MIKLCCYFVLLSTCDNARLVTQTIRTLTTDWRPTHQCAAQFDTLTQTKDQHTSMQHNLTPYHRLKAYTPGCSTIWQFTTDWRPTHQCAAQFDTLPQTKDQHTSMQHNLTLYHRLKTNTPGCSTICISFVLTQIPCLDHNLSVFTPFHPLQVLSFTKQTVWNDR